MPIIGGPLGPSLAPWIRSKPSLLKALQPIAQIYANACGYRQLGMRYDDLIQPWSNEVQTAIGRLSENEGYDRQYRIRRGIQQTILHRDLPKAEWTKPEDDIRYLTPHVQAVINEAAERTNWDNLSVEKRA